MQIKLTPINEGGLLPTTLPDLVQLCRATPAAPICSPIGDAIGNLCAVLASLPLCSEEPNIINSILNGGKAPAGTSTAAPKNPVSSLLPQTSPSPSTGGGGPGGTLVDKLRGLLGGGAS
jgi:phospholipid/cholesterol/gamma-HCH transport system substrate-binding protein